MSRVAKSVKEFGVVGVTHVGVFHADDILASAMLIAISPNGLIARVPVVDEGSIPEGVIVYDVGGGKYDHHQKGGNGVRADGVPYASAGLIWRDFGERIITSVCGERVITSVCDDLNQDQIERIKLRVDRILIEGVDGTDNGFPAAESTYYNPLTFSGIVSMMNTSWNDSRDEETAFSDAVDFALNTLKIVIQRERAVALAKDIVTEAIGNSENHIMVLEQFVPWQDHLFKSEDPKAQDLWYVVFYDDKRDSWNVQCVPDKLGSFGFRQSIPETWYGDYKATGVPGCTFVHKTGFIAACETREAAMEYATKAVDAAEAMLGN